MAKLSGVNAKKAKSAAGKDPFAPLEDGYYKAKLVKVETGKSKTSGNPMWTWHFKVGEKTLKEFTVVQDNMMWKFGDIFAAFGVPTTTSTDQLLGKEILIELGSELQQEGRGKGKPRNYIAGYPDQSLEPKAFSEDEDDDEKPEADEAVEAAADEQPDF